MRSSTSDLLPRPERLFLYEEPSTPTVDLRELGTFLEETTGLSVETRPEFFSHHDASDVDALAHRLATLKIRDLYHEEQAFEPLLGEVDVERRLLRDPRRRLPGILYDGFRFQALLRGLLPSRERTLRALHLPLTPRLLATFDPGDRVYHARVIVCGFPSVISTSGVVEGPAKPKEFYVARRGYSSLGVTPPTEALKEEIAGRFLDYDDPRMTEVLKGYILQALAYHLTGDPFCDDVACRLYNAHWQEEVLEAQVASGRLCTAHAALLAG